MTYNVRHGLGNSVRGEPCGTVDLDRTAAVIRTQRPDIVAVPEVDRFWARSGGEDQPARLAELVGMNACFAANVVLPPDAHESREREYGVAILSRFPIVSHETLPLPTARGWEPRGMLLARVALDAEPIAVVSTHFQVDQPGRSREGRQQRLEEARALVQAVGIAGIPAIVMGDFNARPDDPELAPLVVSGSGLRDAWRSSGHGAGATVPASADREPEARIDYIFVSDAFAVDSVRVVRDPVTCLASDHYPVVADVALRGR